MALTVPTLTELGNFRGEPYLGDEAGVANSVLTQAVDALWIFTGLDQDPTDPREARIVKYAIMDLSLWIMAQYENRDEINSPFSTERIGSYSYSKMQRSKDSGDSGIYWLDLLFQMIGNASSLDLTQPWSASEWVFQPGFAAQDTTIAYPKDPPEPWGF